MNKCLTCYSNTTNPKFCSRSCSATLSNKLSIKRKKTKKCFSCSSLILSNRKWCKDCFIKENLFDESLTLNDVKFLRKYQPYSRIRDLSRRKYLKSNRPKHCAKCGYSNHIEICHIKAIKDYSLSTTIGEINSLDNLIALCPNHHWELDNNMITIDDIISK